MYGLKFNNTWSKDIGILVAQQPNIPIQSEKIDKISIPGRNGDLIEKQNAFEDITITVSCNFIDRFTFWEKEVAIKKWLLNIKDYKLTFSDNQGYFYKVKCINIDEIKRELRVIGRFDIKFTCDPFAYSYEGQKTITKMGQDSELDLYNDGYDSLPYIKLFGNNPTTLMLTTEETTMYLFQSTHIDEYIELDSELQDCYKGTLNCNKLYSGTFPVLKPGRNQLYWSGNATGLEIIPRWRQL